MYTYEIKDKSLQNKSYVLTVDYWETETPKDIGTTKLFFPPGVVPSDNSISAKIKQILDGIENQTPPPEIDLTKYELNQALIEKGKMTDGQTFTNYVENIKVGD